MSGLSYKPDMLVYGIHPGYFKPKATAIQHAIGRLKKPPNHLSETAVSKLLETLSAPYGTFPIPGPGAVHQAAHRVYELLESKQMYVYFTHAFGNHVLGVSRVPATYLAVIAAGRDIVKFFKLCHRRRDVFQLIGDRTFVFVEDPAAGHGGHFVDLVLYSRSRKLPAPSSDVTMEAQGLRFLKPRLLLVYYLEAWAGQRNHANVASGFHELVKRNIADLYKWMVEHMEIGGYELLSPEARVLLQDFLKGC